ncbi:MAG: DUF2092 domain-containing protein [Verrucomicrobiales bacterium]|nr:DUF2092 domain-containing protein [Verrucomicrobiales bacterium]
MKTLTLSLATIIALLSASCSSLKQNSVTIDPQAEQVLRAMSDKLSSAQQFSFHTSRTIDASLVLGTNIDEAAQVDMFIIRPNKIRIKTHTQQGNRQLLYDGKQVIAYNQKRNDYAKEAAPATIDELIDSVSGDWGVRPPLSDIVVSDPYRSLTQAGGIVQYNKSEVLDSVLCDHLKATQANIDWELWVGQQDRLPRKLIITLKNRDGSPKIVSHVSQWKLSPKFPADLFTLEIPKDAKPTSLIRSH